MTSKIIETKTILYFCDILFVLYFMYTSFIKTMCR